MSGAIVAFGSSYPDWYEEHGTCYLSKLPVRLVCDRGEWMLVYRAEPFKMGRGVVGERKARRTFLGLTGSRPSMVTSARRVA